MSNPTIIVAFLAAIGAIIGGVVAYRKIKPESQGIIASATEAVTKAATDLIESQRTEINGLRDRIGKLEGRLDHVSELETQLSASEAARDAAEAACERLLHRVEELMEIIRAAGLVIPPEKLVPE